MQGLIAQSGQEHLQQLLDPTNPFILLCSNLSTGYVQINAPWNTDDVMLIYHSMYGGLFQDLRAL